MTFSTDALDKVLNRENLAVLLDTYLLIDNIFVEHLDNTITNGLLEKTPIENRLQFIKTYCFCNTAREYILKMWVLEHMLNLMLIHRNIPLDPYWEDKIKKTALLCDRDNKNKPV